MPEIGQPGMMGSGYKGSELRDLGSTHPSMMRAIPYPITPNQTGSSFSDFCVFFSRVKGSGLSEISAVSH